MMKRTCIMVVSVPLLALAAMAQDDLTREREKVLRADLEKMVAQSKVVAFAGGAMGGTVKGAPYSAVEVNESNQVLADGTRIHNQSQTSVYRDSEGRVRRETPEQVTIMDPVAGVTFFLNPKTMTASKGSLSLPAIYNRRVAAPGATAGTFVTGANALSETSTFEVRTKDGVTTATVNGRPVDPSTIKMEHSMMVNGAAVDEQTFTVAKDKLAAEMSFPRMTAVIGGAVGEAGMLRAKLTSPAKTEALGKQMIEGVNADGTRVSTTLETGAIGNDRPIQMESERWYSQELQTVIMTKRTDPRSGEETFRLTNLSRSEPGADLFQVPPSYQLLDRK